jgi:hypothetical protein
MFWAYELWGNSKRQICVDSMQFCVEGEHPTVPGHVEQYWVCRRFEEPRLMSALGVFALDGHLVRARKGFSNVAEFDPIERAAKDLADVEETCTTFREE